jgi:dipeptidyl aminopeptidase/acylaminoacyl peptidase
MPQIPRHIARALGLLLLVTSAGLVQAAEAQPRTISAQDLWAIKRVGAPALSPDGKRVAYSVQEWSIEKNKATASLWLTDLSTSKTRRLTHAQSSDTTPTWDTQGQRIAFVAKRGDDETAALYVIAADGGEAEEIVELPYGISNPQWLPEQQGIVFATQVIPELAGKLAKEDLAAIKKEAKRRKDSKMTAYATDYRQYRFFDKNLTDKLANRLVKVDLATKSLIDLTPGFDRLFMASGEVRYEIAPNGRTLALALNSTPTPFAQEPNNDIYLLPTDGSGTLKNLTPDNVRNDDAPHFSPDGRTLLFVRQVLPTQAGELRRLWQHTLADGRNAPLTARLDLSIEEAHFSSDGRSIYFQAEEQGRVPLFSMRADGTGLKRLFAQGSNTALEVAGGSVVFLHEHNHRAAELYVLDPARSGARKLTGFNDALFAQLDLGQVESHTFTGAGGAPVQLWLTYPPGFDAAKKYPLLQLLHGGPHTMVRDSFGYRWNHHVFASPGYIVAWVNRHGSTGFGEAFARSIHGAWGEKPMEDVLKANAYLFDKIPAIDRNNVAAAGASYGGYLASWMLGHTDAFKTLVNHAGVSDLMSQYGADITTYGFNAEVLGGTPWDDAEAMQRNNPMSYAQHFKTPTLILHGELDYRVPYGQGLALYGVLQGMRVPSRLVVFPNENHWILSPQNAIYWNYEVQDWLARYIGGKPMAKPVFEAASDEAGKIVGARHALPQH